MVTIDWDTVTGLPDVQKISERTYDDVLLNKYVYKMAKDERYTGQPVYTSPDGKRLRCEQMCGYHHIWFDINAYDKICCPECKREMIAMILSNRHTCCENDLLEDDE